MDCITHELAIGDIVFDLRDSVALSSKEAAHGAIVIDDATLTLALSENIPVDRLSNAISHCQVEVA